MLRLIADGPGTQAADHRLVAVVSREQLRQRARTSSRSWWRCSPAGWEFEGSRGVVRALGAGAKGVAGACGVIVRGLMSLASRVSACEV